MYRRKPMSLDFDDAFGCMFGIVLVGGIAIGIAVYATFLHLVVR